MAIRHIHSSDRDATAMKARDMLEGRKDESCAYEDGGCWITAKREYNEGREEFGYIVLAIEPMRKKGKE